MIKMFEDSLRRWNPWWATGKVPKELLGTEREKLTEVKESLKTKRIKDVIGVRRCGKTTLFYQTIQNLIDKGKNPENIFLINFDDSEVYNTELESILQKCREINPDVEYMFLDEVQEKKGWERWVRSLYDTKQFKQIFVSGSTSSIVKSKVSRTLTGRHTTLEMYPFSFKEYLRHKAWGNLEPEHLEHRKGELLNQLKKYMEYGGFPETLKKEDPVKNKILTDLFDDIISRDVASRHGADYEITRKIAHYLTSHSSQEQSARSIAGATGASTKTASKYLDYLKQSFLIYPLKRFSWKLKEQMNKPKKYYCIDTGLVNAVGFKFTQDLGRILENIVFLELRRRKEKELYYWKDKRGRDIDFVIRDENKTKQLIEACYDPTSTETRKREEKSLLKGMKELNMDEALVITWDHEEKKELKGKEIEYKPLWKWLLIQDSQD